MRDVCTGGKEAKTRQLDDIEEHPQMAAFRRYHNLCELGPRLRDVARLASFVGVLLMSMGISVIIHYPATSHPIFFNPGSFSSPCLVVTLFLVFGLEALAAAAVCLLLSYRFCREAVSIKEKLSSADEGAKEA